MQKYKKKRERKGIIGNFILLDVIFRNQTSISEYKNAETPPIHISLCKGVSFLSGIAEYVGPTQLDCVRDTRSMQNQTNK